MSSEENTTDKATGGLIKDKVPAWLEQHPSYIISRELYKNRYSKLIINLYYHIDVGIGIENV